MSSVVSGTSGLVNAWAAHFGTWGAVALDWMDRDDADATVERGDVISSWIRFSNDAAGQAWFGFGASAGGTLALVLAPETGQLLLREPRPPEQNLPKEPPLQGADFAQPRASSVFALTPGTGPLPRVV